MWDDKFAALVDEIEEGLRDEEGMFDANNDEMTEISSDEGLMLKTSAS